MVIASYTISCYFLAHRPLYGSEALRVKNHFVRLIEMFFSRVSLNMIKLGEGGNVFTMIVSHMEQFLREMVKWR